MSVDIDARMSETEESAEYSPVLPIEVGQVIVRRTSSSIWLKTLLIDKVPVEFEVGEQGEAFQRLAICPSVIIRPHSTIKVVIAGNQTGFIESATVTLSSPN